MTPYDKDYVLDRTFENVRSAIEFSTKKTMMRNVEFTDVPEKQKEIMDTLVALGHFHRIIDEFETWIKAQK